MNDGQLPLFGAAREQEGMVENPAQADTSAEAAREIRPMTGKLRLVVLDAITAAGGHGLTDEEGQEYTGLPASTYRPRRVELDRGYKDVEGGWIADSGRRRPTASGRKAKVWIATGKPS